MGYNYARRDYVSKLRINVGIQAASSLQMVGFGLIGIIPAVIAHYVGFNETTVQTAFSIPMLMSVPASLITGWLSPKIGKRVPLLGGVALVFLVGTIPALVDVSFFTFVMVLAIIGIGAGCIATTCTGLIADHFEGHERSIVMGLQSTFTNVGGMLIAFLGGLLIDTGNWRNAFFIYLYAIPIFIILLICLPTEKTTASAEIKPVGKTKLNRDVLVLCSMMLFIGFVVGIANTNAALLVEERGLGSHSIANYAASWMRMIGIVVGILFGLFAKTLKKFLLPIAFLVFAVGMFIIAYSNYIAVFYFGHIVAGAGISVAMPAGLTRCAQSAGSASATFAMSMFLSANSLAMFFSPMIINPVSLALADGTARSRFTIGAIVATMVSFTVFLYLRFEKSHQQV